MSVFVAYVMILTIFAFDEIKAERMAFHYTVVMATDLVSEDLMHFKIY